MVLNKVARRYAKSLLLLAQERNELENINAEMKSINSVISANKDLKVFLKSPIVKKDKKVNILNQIFADSMGDVVKSFVSIITKNNREYLLYDISVAFLDLYNETNKVVTAQVTSAVELNDDVLSKLKEIVGVLENNEVKIESKIDSDLIGGVVLRVGDSQIDTSVARQLRELKKELTTEDYSIKI
ncbi:MAG: ATP synthase F1 subunit delta [Salibacteraceae bacterium]